MSPYSQWSGEGKIKEKRKGLQGESNGYKGGALEEPKQLTTRSLTNPLNVPVQGPIHRVSSGLERLMYKHLFFDQ